MRIARQSKSMPLLRRTCVAVYVCIKALVPDVCAWHAAWSHVQPRWTHVSSTTKLVCPGFGRKTYSLLLHTPQCLHNAAGLAVDQWQGPPFEAAVDLTMGPRDTESTTPRGGHDDGDNTGTRRMFDKRTLRRMYRAHFDVAIQTYRSGEQHAKVQVLPPSGTAVYLRKRPLFDKEAEDFDVITALARGT